MTLTPREKEITRLVSQGLANREIADALGIAVHTTKEHLENIYRKAGMNRVQLAVWWATRKGVQHDNRHSNTAPRQNPSPRPGRKALHAEIEAMGGAR